MGRTTYVRPGLPRLYADHRRWEGIAQRRAFQTYEEEFGLHSALLRQEAWRVAALAVEVQVTTRGLQEARMLRRDGKGRRPNPKAIERLARRAGLANLSYSQALDKLREMAHSNGDARTPDSILADVNRAMADERDDG